MKKTFAILTTTLVTASEFAAADKLSHTLVADQPHDHREVLVDRAVPTTSSPISFSGGQVQHAVVTVKGWNPDRFFIITRSSEVQNGKFWEWTYELTESDLRSELSKLGYEDREIMVRIVKARLSPVA